MGWRAVFSRIYEVVTSPRQAQVSFDSVIYANVMCHALKMMHNTFTCGHGHLQQLAAFAHVPQKRTRCIHHGPRGVTTSCLATRSGGGPWARAIRPKWCSRSSVLCNWCCTSNNNKNIFVSPALHVRSHIHLNNLPIERSVTAPHESIRRPRSPLP